MGFDIDFNSVPSATTPFETNSEPLFKARAAIAIQFAATQGVPLSWLIHLFLDSPIRGEDAVVGAIARLEYGGDAEFTLNGQSFKVDNITMVNSAARWSGAKLELIFRTIQLIASVIGMWLKKG